jgi:hypothetical protein
MSTTIQSRLDNENVQYANSGGISQNNSAEHFVPAFKNVHTGEIALSRYSNGKSAPFHLIDGLPDSWLSKEGNHKDLEEFIISGFVRFGRFFDRQEAADFIEQGA